MVGFDSWLSWVSRKARESREGHKDEISQCHKMSMCLILTLTECPQCSKLNRLGNMKYTRKHNIFKQVWSRGLFFLCLVLPAGEKTSLCLRPSPNAVAFINRGFCSSFGLGISLLSLASDNPSVPPYVEPSQLN